ncbi:zinc metalloproteinase nas-8 [Nephila pilipes]|uniref:Metalloendopeptidase n=1 Tax=Nephila pilipes TaxID=299642 RepID=A0A8X6P3K2_NEPPI|nr:zinc metalloproteinase nas-8 [Nephila pilipes]
MVWYKGSQITSIFLISVFIKLHLLAMEFPILALLAFLHVTQGAISTLIEDLYEKYVEPEYLEKLYKTGKFEEFSKLLQIDNVDLVRPAKGNQSGDPMFNTGLEGGDILLRPWQRETARQGIIFSNADTNSKWRRYVPYIINRNGYTSSQVMKIEKAILKWNTEIPNIRFRPRSRLFNRDYVMFFNGNGCYSNLGRVGGQQSISLSADGCLTEGTILHEMSHSIGFIHEHNRPDRDQYLRILTENIPADWLSQYDKASSEDIKLLGKYDYYSVMHYPIPAPKTGKPSFQVLQKNIDLKKIGQRDGLTDTDKEKIRKLYS